jgi:hypothetical protein
MARAVARVTGPDPSRHLRRLLRDRVGGFFPNARHQPGVTCAVCAGPAAGDRCQRCAAQHAEFGPRLADHVLTLAYARGRAPTQHQSEHTLYAYKAVPPSPKSADDLSLMVMAATRLHGDCLARRAGRPWSAVTFVPSAQRPGATHPVAQLARAVQDHTPDQRFLLDLGPSITIELREVLPDRFYVRKSALGLVRGAHVLIVDDTWTSGSKAQSAALAVRAAGADLVTVLCIARWCRHDWPDHRALLDSCASPYDATVCPVTGGTCPP